MNESKHVNDLIIDDSFINYCFNRDQKDYDYWESRRLQFPQEKEKIEEARKIVINLHLALEERHSIVGEDIPFLSSSQTTELRDSGHKKRVKYFMVAATISVIFFLGFFLFKPSIQTSNELTRSRVEPRADSPIYRTMLGERKMLTLSDSTKIWLNANTALRVDNEYGKKDRKIYLSGEALFDVQHNESLPFIVYTANYQVLDLGTVFNVKAYPGDTTSEASLIRGKIDIVLVKNEKRVSLKPNQKMVVKNEISGFEELENGAVNKTITGAFTHGKPEIIKPLNYNEIDGMLIETSWLHRLEIDNESFYQIKDKLERWFGINVVIQDAKVGRYRFTATFKKENIQEVLHALQYAYPFNFKINDDQVIISK